MLGQDPMDPSRPLQRTLYQAAKRSRKRRFHALYDRIFRPDILWRAWREVRANGGSAGADGVRIEDIAQRGVEAFLQALAQDPRAWQKLTLTAHPTKTRMVDRQQAGFALLGFHFHKGRARRTGKRIPLMSPGQKAMKAIRSHMREQTKRRGLKYTLKGRVAKLNPLIRGWRNYVRVGNATKKFQDLDR